MIVVDLMVETRIAANNHHRWSKWKPIIRLPVAVVRIVKNILKSKVSLETAGGENEPLFSPPPIKECSIAGNFPGQSIPNSNLVSWNINAAKKM
jgi:hypothetical protein